MMLIRPLGDYKERAQTVTANTDHTQTKRQRGRKVAAILAGGLVLGVGTMATLASWNDSEFAKAEFTAGTFVFQGTADNSEWKDHKLVGDAASLSFTTPVANLTPNDVVGASFAVRLGAGTTHSADVTVTSLAPTGANASHLTYRLVKTATWQCDKNTTGSEVLIADTDLGSGSKTFELTAPASGEGAPYYVCFQVKAKGSLLQSEKANATWQFSAVSK